MTDERLLAALREERTAAAAPPAPGTPPVWTQPGPRVAAILESLERRLEHGPSEDGPDDAALRDRVRALARDALVRQVRVERALLDEGLAAYHAGLRGEEQRAAELLAMLRAVDERLGGDGAPEAPPRGIDPETLRQRVIEEAARWRESVDSPPEGLAVLRHSSAGSEAGGDGGDDEQRRVDLEDWSAYAGRRHRLWDGLAARLFPDVEVHDPAGDAELPALLAEVRVEAEQSIEVVRLALSMQDPAAPDAAERAQHQVAIETRIAEVLETLRACEASLVPGGES